MRCGDRGKRRTPDVQHRMFECIRWKDLSGRIDPESFRDWLKDKFGLSWQVTPRILSELILDKDEAKSQRAMKAMMEMEKIDIAELRRAYTEK
jgi:predicted 3-demethylubiquinone-9 3-methyltransferase (glyoxalase superfamily)